MSSAALPGALPLALTTPDLLPEILQAGQWTPSPNATEELLASLPFASAQKALPGPVVPRTARHTICSWHGLRIDSLRGSFAVVRTGSPLEDLVGERLRVTDLRTRRVVYVYCRAEVIDLPDDLTLARRAFLALRPLWTETASVKIEVLA